MRLLLGEHTLNGVVQFGLVWCNTVYLIVPVVRA